MLENWHFRLNLYVEVSQCAFVSFSVVSQPPMQLLAIFLFIGGRGIDKVKRRLLGSTSASFPFEWNLGFAVFTPSIHLLLHKSTSWHTNPFATVVSPRRSIQIRYIRVILYMAKYTVFIILLIFIQIARLAETFKNQGCIPDQWLIRTGWTHPYGTDFYPSILLG